MTTPERPLHDYLTAVSERTGVRAGFASPGAPPGGKTGLILHSSAVTRLVTGL
jgi:hypothetical protein